jgi:hypothetical protein
VAVFVRRMNGFCGEDDVRMGFVYSRVKINAETTG